MKLKCDWCPKPIRGAAHQLHRRHFCSKVCKKAFEDFQEKVYDPVRTHPYVPERNADV